MECSNRSPTAITAVTAKPTATTPAAIAGCPAAMRSPATNGPANVPRPSPVPQAMLAAMSSPGLRAMPGMSVAAAGRIGAPATAPTVARTYRRMVGSPPAITTATRAAVRARATPSDTRTRRPPNLLTTVPASIPATTAGPIRTAPRMPAATTPSCA